MHIWAIRTGRTGIVRPELRPIYEASNEKLARWVAMSTIAVHRMITPTFVVTTAIPVLFNYYFVDHTENAFVQLFPEQLSCHSGCKPE